MRKERKNNQMRTIKSEINILNRADGSVRHSQGDSEVIVAIFGPKEVQVNKEFPDKATIQVIFKPKTKFQTNVEKEYENILKDTFEDIILTKDYPRSLISIIVQVINDEGSVNLLFKIDFKYCL
jgi:exosome complex component RRP46